MSVELVVHPDGSNDAVQRMQATATREIPGRLELDFRLWGDTARLRIPPPATPGRRDELWRHTCVEAFVAPAGRPEYIEYNLAPSGEWAAYRFDDYRAGMAELPTAAPRVALVRGDDGLRLSARVALPDAFADVPLRVCLAAVVEDVDGRLGYWALHHPAVRPDFHRRDGFTLEL